MRLGANGLTVISLMKLILHCFFATAVTAILFVNAASGLESTDDLIAKGKVFEKKFQAKDALPLYLSAEKEDPKDPELLVRIARQYRYLMTDAADTKEKLRLGYHALEYSNRAAE